MKSINNRSINSVENNKTYIGNKSNNVLHISKWYRMRYAIQKANLERIMERAFPASFSLFLFQTDHNFFGSTHENSAIQNIKWQ